jgi:hypothetical protein
MENITYDVRIWQPEAYRGPKVTTYTVRWKAGDRRWKQPFRVKAQADTFAAELRTAARKGEACIDGQDRAAQNHLICTRAAADAPGPMPRRSAGVCAGRHGDLATLRDRRQSCCADIAGSRISGPCQVGAACCPVSSRGSSTVRPLSARLAAGAPCCRLRRCLPRLGRLAVFTGQASPRRIGRPDDQRGRSGRLEVRRSPVRRGGSVSCPDDRWRTGGTGSAGGGSPVPPTSRRRA